MATNVTARDVRVTQRNALNSICCTNVHQSRRKVFLFASKQQCVDLRWHNLPVYKAVNSIM